MPPENSGRPKNSAIRTPHSAFKMTDVIQLLPESIANQIAAGEVVQRPASVVKELLENAVDAGATVIKLIVKDAGKTLVQVIDNGCGMSETDARMSFERHATSKIREAKDLFSIQTMGFRGEALASIAAIAQVELRTRRQFDELGTLIQIDNSTVQIQEPCQTAAGTSFSVKNLFFNVPARRNFLKADAVEMKHIVEEFEHVALAQPDLFFSFHHNGQEIMHLPAGNLRQRIVGVFGQNLNKNLVPVGEDTDVLKISGFVGKPEHLKKTRGEQFFFVNKRFIKSSYLHHAMMAAYEGLLTAESFPLYVIFLEIDPSRIDVNVHPTKQEIKFDDEKLIYNYLKVAVRHALGTHAVVPMMDFDSEISFGNMTSNQPAANLPAASGKSLTFEDFMEKKSDNPAPNYRPETIGGGSNSLNANNLRNWQTLYQGLELFDKKDEPEDVESLLAARPSEDFGSPDDDETANSFTIESKWETEPNRLDDESGSFSRASKEPYQIHGQYIVSQLKSGFLLIDQQAASERVLFEKNMVALLEQPVGTQQALFPKTIHLSPGDARLLKDILPEINRLGFDISEFGREAFLVQGVPADLPGGSDEQTLMEKLLHQYKSNHDLNLGSRENIARSMARSASVKRGQAMNTTEMQQLIDQLFACEAPFSSPTGKPTFITFDLDDIKKRFS